MSRNEQTPEFGHMHEDPAAELQWISRAEPRQALVICSGGDLAFLLMAYGWEVKAIDSNPAQVELVRIKRRLLEKLGPERAARLMTSDARHAIRDIDPDCVWLERSRAGLAFCGRMDDVLRWAGPVLSCAGNGMWRLAGWAGRLWHGMQQVDWPKDWALRMGQRHREVAIRNDAAKNPWLHALYGRRDERALPWIWTQEGQEQALPHLQRLHLAVGDIMKELAAASDGAFHLISVSNVPDMITQEARKALWQEARRVLVPGGGLIVRSMVWKAEELPQLEGMEWQPAPEDSSPLCPVVGIWVKQY